ncbi:MAG: DUF6879 family protein [Nocardioides sp.]
MVAEPTFEELLADCGRTAVHLEMRDCYSTKSPAFVAWQVDRSVSPLAWYGAWPGIIGPAVRRGVTVRRARIVSEPVSEYVRFEHDFTGPLNLAAGEEVRWLWRRLATDLTLPGNDFWLFDDRLVQVNHFSGDGEAVAHETTADPDVVKLCAASFAAVWERAVPHEDFQLS